jgi:threonine dehydrogenase-like Zn-dependent dehydrogenase
LTVARAALISAPGKAEIVEIAARAPGPGEVRVRIEGCGVCGSDLPVWQGRTWFRYPRDPGAPGHEPWGVVEAVGPGVTRLAEGDRVAGLMYRGYCDVEVAPEGHLVRLPDALRGAPFPGEALACAVNVFRRSEITGGDRVAVVGAGFLGTVVTQLAARVGAQVIAVSRRPSALEVARCMGAQETVELADDAVERVADLTGSELCDVVVEAAGVQSTLDLAGPLTRTRGRLVIAGFHQDGRRQVDMQLWNWRGLDVINAHERDERVYLEGLELAARLVADGALDPAPLYTHTFPLDDLAEALGTLEARPDGFMKALVLT